MAHTQTQKTLGATLTAVVLLAFPLFGQKNSCIECHQQLEDSLKAPVAGMAQDIHQKFGLSCRDCHGGNPTQDDADLAKDKTFKGAPKKARIPEFCGACHSDAALMRKFNPNIRIDQLELYRTSQHGRLLAKGDSKVAVCTDCHGVHGILPASMPKSSIFPWNVPQTCGRCHADAKYMQSYGIPTDQVEEYKASVHAKALYDKKDLSAPACNDCHGNHGALPPSVSSIAFVCRQCHASTGELFSQSPHKAALDKMGLAECEACHGRHKILPPTDDLIGTGKTAVCIQCHDSGSKAFEIAARVKGLLDAYVQNMARADSKLEQADRRGVEVSEPKFRLKEAQSTLTEMRNLTHGLSLEVMTKKSVEGENILSDVLKAGDDALQEAKTRRTGLIVATAFLGLLALALFLKIKQINAKKKA